MDLRRRRNRPIHEVGLEPSLERFLCGGGQIVTLINEGLTPRAIGKLREPVPSFTRNVCGVFHVSPPTEFDSGLTFDRLERADGEIFTGVRYRHDAGFARVLVLLVATLCMNEVPAVSEKDLNDLS